MALNPATERLKSASWKPLEMGQTASIKLMALGAKNMASALQFAEDLSRVRTPMDFFDAVTNQTRRQFEAINDQFRELTSLPEESMSKTEEAEGAGLGD